MLEKGKIMVHKSHGICTINDIIKIGDQTYYKIIPSFDESMSIFVPLSKENELLREVLSQQEAENLINYMRNIDKEIVEDSKERRDAFHKKLLSGDLKDLAYLCRKLFLLKQAKNDANLKFCLTDSAMFDKANKMLLDELAISYNMKREEIEEFIKNKIEE